ncbi:MAG: STAS domain-containing protein [Planctomycetes bacterium]|nr:STAS domain-containing protein [Planctomycetota bacterium]
MKIKTQDYNDVTVVELQGELDSEFAEMFQNTVMNVISADKRGIVLDMSEVSFIDSEGLEKMLWLRDYCNENNCQIRLAGLDENCEKILEITQMEKEFDSYAELTQAVKSFV